MRSSEPPGNFSALAQSRKIPLECIPDYYEAVLSICQAAAKRYEGSMLTVGIGGAQGTGKSTMSFMVKNILDQAFSISAEILSIDDYYLTRNERLALAAKIHPLLAVRGVPGTHDMYWMQDTISSLRNGETCKVPVFSKGEDDRLHYEEVKNPPEILILEGWCWGARHVKDQELQRSVNDLEARRDPDLIWRRFVNQALASEIYQKCFSTDLRVFLNAPDMEAIFRWRLQQESQLISGRRKMNEPEIRNFIMHYQRISERMQKQDSADITVFLGGDHEVVRVSNRFLA
mgnify:CR=1 FL=1